jgi:hypothetical protein
MWRANSKACSLFWHLIGCSQRIRPGSPNKSIPHTAVTFYGDCVKMCEAAPSKFGDKITGCRIMTSHCLTPFYIREFFNKNNMTVILNLLFFSVSQLEWLHCKFLSPSSRQRGCPTEIRQQFSDSNIPAGSNIWLQVPQGRSIPRHTDRLTVSRKETSTIKSKGCHFDTTAVIDAESQEALNTLTMHYKMAE